MEINIFNELFLSLEIWGWFGPMLVVYVGFYLVNKNKFLGVLWFLVEALMVTRYYSLVTATPAYWMHMFIILLGGTITCLWGLMQKK